MGLVRSKEEISKRVKKFSQGYTLGETVLLNVLFTTTFEAIERVLPPPLELPPAPTATAFIAEYHKPNFCRPYNEGALFVSAAFEGVVGSYCLSMPVTHDIAMLGGREIYGYPKKIAEKIEVVKEGNKVQGTCIRRGVPLIEINAELSEPFTDDIASSPHYLVKSFIDEKGMGPDLKPRLVKQINQLKWGPREIGEGTLKLGSSIHDPLGEIPVEEVMMALYAEESEILMPSGEIVAELDPREYEPYMYIKYDWDW